MTLIKKILLFLICAPVLCFGQSYLDSLKSRLEIDRPDSATIETLYLINDHFRKLEMNDSLSKYARAQIDIGKSIGQREAISWGYYDLAGAHWDLGQYDSGLIAADSARHSFLVQGDTTRSFNSLYLKGMIFGDMGRFDNAIECYYKAIRGYEDRGNILNQGAVLNSVALVHQWMGDLNEAENEFNRSIEILEETEDKWRLALSMSNLGFVQAELGRLEEAYATQIKTLALFEEVESEWGITSVKGNIGYVLLQLNRPNEALPYLNANMEYQRKKEDKKELASVLMMRADVHSAIGDIELAESDLYEALDLSESSGTIDYIYQIHEQLSELALGKGDFKEAFLAQSRSIALKDTLFANEKIKAVTDATKRYETEKKEAEIALLSAENEIKDSQLKNESNVRKGLLGGFGLLAVIAALLVNGQRKKISSQRALNEKNREIREAEVKRDMSDLELKALRAQMNPHFIFNSMNSINRLILEERNEDASRNLTRFSKLVRMILDFSERKTVSLREEVDFLETYIGIESNRFKGKIRCHLNIDPNLDMEETSIPSMILQPFVENSIWHGLMHKENGDGQIDIGVTEKDGVLICTIEDNGIGRQRAKELKANSSLSHHSMAMKITEARLSNLNKSELEGSIDITDLVENDQPVGTLVQVRIPL